MFPPLFPRRPFLLPAFLVALLFAVVSARGDGETPEYGSVVERVVCRDNLSQSYALYLPSNYSPDRSWPVLYCFDPQARGRVPVELFRRAAERHGFIVIGSNNSRNGPWDAILTAGKAVVADTHDRFRLDAKRQYSAGFSGGARAASAAAASGGFAGVVACSGGFPQSQFPENLNAAYFETAGVTDFNFAEMQEVSAELARRALPHRLTIFSGGHQWMPEQLTEDALAWFDLRAMRSGALAPVQTFLVEQLKLRLESAAALVAADERAAAYRCIVSDFEGVLEVSEVKQRVDRLERSKEFKRAVAATAKSLREQKEWTAELAAAAFAPGDSLTASHASTPASRPRDPFEQASPSDNAPGDADASPGAWLANAETPSARLVDPRARLRNVVATLHRREKKNPAAARAIAAVVASCIEEGSRHHADGEWVAAIRCFELATLIEPDRRFAYMLWARTCAAQGDKRSAEERLKLAVAKGFTDKAQIAALRAEFNRPEVKPDSVIKFKTPDRNLSSPKRITVRPVHLALRSLAPDAPVRTAADSPPQDAPVQLEPMKVSSKPITSFALALKILAVPETKQVARILVDQVAPSSEAAAKQICPGDEILTVDATPVGEFVASFDRSSELSQRFIDRKRGDRITLQILSPNDDAPRTVTLTQGLEEGRMVGWLNKPK